VKEDAPRGALLLIDLLNDFIDPKGALPCGPAGEEAAREASRLAERFRRAGRPVIYVCDRHLPDDREFRMWPVHCVDGTWGAEIHSSVARVEGDLVIPKRRYSGFFGTDLDNRLREMGVTVLTLAGVCTNICVLYTAVDASMRGYDVSVVQDACASYDQAAHAFAIRELGNTIKVNIA